MRIVVTGASGNVGTGLLRALAQDTEDHEVIGVCRRPPRPEPGDTVRWESIDLGGHGVRTRLAEVMAGADAVVHLAWAIQPVRDEATLHRVNVDGTRAVLDAAATAGVEHVVHASSIGVYAAGADGKVDERWPATGLASSVYSRNKTAAENVVDLFARDHPDITVTSVRPTLVAQRSASASFAALFLRPLFHPRLLRFVDSRLVPLLPLPSPLRVQLVHADDVGRAVVAILRRRVGGPVNLASSEVLSGDSIAEALHGKAVPVPARWVRRAVSALWTARLLRMSPGWFDVATLSPLIDTSRAERELDWRPVHSSSAALREQLDGIADLAEGSTPALRLKRLELSA